jgi:hypothetical protein
MYHIASDQLVGTSIVRVVDTEVAFIPMDETNQHYQQYLAWVAEGNTAEEWSPNATV